MKKFLLLIFSLTWFVSVSQNWSAYTASYRYNYCFNNSAIISNVIFAFSSSYPGSDTIYGLNLIGTPCVKGCPTLTASVGSSVITIPNSRMIVPDQPQFLQRKVKKFANGTVMFYDTTSMVIQPMCSVGQTWIFDSLNSVNATCSSIYTKTIFSIVDSVKRILLSTGDTILLSKQFGIIQFPLPYSKNQYYRLVGIEKRTSYDPTALYGQKVPNFWDFYNFNIGDEFYRTGSKCDYVGTIISMPLTTSLYYEKSKVLGKQINANSYTYTMQTTSQGIYLTNQPGCYTWYPSLPITNTTNVVTYSNTDIFSVSVNKMYPGLLDEASTSGYVSPVMFGIGTFNLVSFLHDMKGRFSKKTGFYCPASTNPPINDTFIGLKYYSSLNLLIPSNYYNSSFSSTPSDRNQKIFTVGLGDVRYEYDVFEHSWYNCLNSAIIGSDTLFGPMPAWGFGVGIQEQTAFSGMRIFPNPANDHIIIKSENEITNVIAYDCLGNKLFESAEKLRTNKINTSDWKDGIYFIRLQDKETVRTEKIVIQKN